MCCIHQPHSFPPNTPKFYFNYKIKSAHELQQLVLTALDLPFLGRWHRQTMARRWRQAFQHAARKKSGRNGQDPDIASRAAALVGADLIRRRVLTTRIVSCHRTSCLIVRFGPSPVPGPSARGPDPKAGPVAAARGPAREARQSL